MGGTGSGRTGSGLTIDFGPGRYQSPPTFVQDGACNGGRSATSKTLSDRTSHRLVRALLQFLSAWWLAAACPVSADNSPSIPEYSVRPWRLEDGLPFETITAFIRAAMATSGWEPTPAPSGSMVSSSR